MSNRTWRSVCSRASLKSVLSSAPRKSFVGARPSTSRTASLRSINEKHGPIKVQLHTSRPTKGMSPGKQRSRKHPIRTPKNNHFNKSTSTTLSRLCSLGTVEEDVCTVHEANPAKLSDDTLAVSESKGRSQSQLQDSPLLLSENTEERDDVTDVATRSRLAESNRDTDVATHNRLMESNRDDDVSLSEYSLVPTESILVGDASRYSSLGCATTFDTYEDMVEQEIRKLRTLTLSDLWQLTLRTLADDVLKLTEDEVDIQTMPESKRRSFDQETTVSDITDEAYSNEHHQSALYSMVQTCFKILSGMFTRASDEPIAIQATATTALEHTEFNADIPVSPDDVSNTDSNGVDTSPEGYKDKKGLTLDCMYALEESTGEESVEVNIDELTALSILKDSMQAQGD